MELHYKQEVTVGLLVMAAAAIFIGGAMWLAGVPLVGNRRVTVAVQFDDVRGLAAGDAVLVSGMQVGRVSDVILEGVGQVRVDLRLDTDTWRPRIDAEAAVESFDFLGSKFVNYSPGAAEQFLSADQRIQGRRSADPLEGAGGLMDQAAAVLEGVQTFVAPEVLAELTVTLEAVRGALTAFTEIADGPLLAEATTVMQSAGNAMVRIDSLLANPGLERSVTRLDSVTASMQEMTGGLTDATTTLNSILEEMLNGDGSVAMALRDSSMYNNVNDVLVSLKMLIDDLRERPGRYLHLKVF
jgi:phospholipid/cholesterol/gamma-HCH transport system substrate-binding protein